MFTCPLHNWFSTESECPSCIQSRLQTVSSATGTITPDPDTPGEEGGTTPSLDKIYKWLERKSQRMKVGERYTYNDVVALIASYIDETPASPAVREALDVTDLQDQVRKHIREHQLFNWDEALTDEEMIYLENLLLTFMPIVPYDSVGGTRLREAWAVARTALAGEGEEQGGGCGTNSVTQCWFVCQS